MTARLLFVLALLAAFTVRAQTGEDVLRYSQRFPAVDVRMTGLAGAAVGGVGDWGAAFANPAGLGLVERSYVTGALSTGSVESDAQYFDGSRGATVTQTAVGSAAYVAALPTLRGSFVLGFGYNQTAGFDRGLAFDGFNSTVGTEQYGELFEDGLTGEYSVAGAVEVAPGVYTGASLNLVAGDYQFQQLLDEGGSVTDAYLETDLRGFNVRGGVSATAAPGLRFGFSAETPTIYRVEERSFDFFETGIFDYSITTPWRVAGGVVYEQGDRRGGFLLAADLEFLDWSQARLRPTADFAASGANVDIRSTYREVFNTRLGAEYRIGPWAVRAGAAYQPDPLREELDLRGVEADRLRETYTVGFSFAAGHRAAIDVGYAYTEFEDAFVPDAGSVVREEVARNRFLVGVRVGI